MLAWRIIWRIAPESSAGCLVYCACCSLFAFKPPAPAACVCMCVYVCVYLEVRRDPFPGPGLLGSAQIHSVPSESPDTRHSVEPAANTRTFASCACSGSPAGGSVGSVGAGARKLTPFAAPLLLWPLPFVPLLLWWAAVSSQWSAAGWGAGGGAGVSATGSKAARKSSAGERGTQDRIICARRHTRTHTHQLLACTGLPCVCSLHACPFQMHLSAS